MTKEEFIKQERDKMNAFRDQFRVDDAWSQVGQVGYDRTYECECGFKTFDPGTIFDHVCSQTVSSKMQRQTELGQKDELTAEEKAELADLTPALAAYFTPPVYVDPGVARAVRTLDLAPQWRQRGLYIVAECSAHGPLVVRRENIDQLCPACRDRSVTTYEARRKGLDEVLGALLELREGLEEGSNGAALVERALEGLTRL
jgi:hypothetical protein